MKKMLTLAFLAVLTTQTFAATVESARIDKSGKNLLIEVSYAGGCQEHKFELSVGGCLESFPLQCSAILVDKTVGDSCEGLMFEEVSISLKKAGLTDDYFAGAYLTISGDRNSKANVQLP